MIASTANANRPIPLCPLAQRSIAGHSSLAGRWRASLATVVLAAVVAVAQLAADAAFDLRIETSYLLSMVVLCALLAAVLGRLAVALAGVRARPSMVRGIGIGVAIVGYLIAALFPLSDLLAPWRHLSPWDWALGGNPLEGPTRPGAMRRWPQRPASSSASAF